MLIRTKGPCKLSVFALIVLILPLSCCGQCRSGQYGAFTPVPTGIDGDYVFHEFIHNSTGSATATSIEVVESIQSAEILIIGGGGGGGGSVPQYRGCGGGGAGRLLWYQGIVIQAGVLTVTVGAGGTSGMMSWGYTSGGTGKSSNFLGYTAIGGGAGGGTSIEVGSSGRDGGSGGSGGGGGDPAGARGSSIGTNSPQSFGSPGGRSVINTRGQWNGAGAGGGGAGGNGQDTSGAGNVNPGPGGSGKSMDITGIVKVYAKGGNGNIATDFPATVQHMGHGGNGGKGYGNGYVGGSGVVIIRYKRRSIETGSMGNVASSGVAIIDYPSRCVACPEGLISTRTSKSLSDCTLPCPAGHFSSSIASNVGRMCGAAQNEACPTELSSVGYPTTVASNGNDGSIAEESLVLSEELSDNAHTFRIDLEKTQNIQSVKFFNRVNCCNDRMMGAEIRIGPSATWEENAICATLNSDLIQTYRCNHVGRYIFLVVSAERAQANFALNFLELQAFSTCTICPANTVALPDSLSFTVCTCKSGSFEETRVLNPPYTQRTYSSILQPANLDKSLLDDIGSSWSSQTLSAGEWMELDVGQPMQIVGIISQGHGISAAGQEQYVTQFRVEYRLGDVLGVGVPMPGNFSMINGFKKEHIFSIPIHARYIRIVVLAWSGRISMRAALLVKSCSMCFSDTLSLQGSTVSSACECPVGAYKQISAIRSSAIVLVPARAAQLSTLANRNQRSFEATAIFDPTAGPPGSKGAVTFTRGLLQYLNGGTHKFNIASNGGFTIVSVVKFSGAPAMGERILDFGNGTDNDNVIIYRHHGDTILLSLRNGITECFIFTQVAIIQNAWFTLVATYESSSRNMTLSVGNMTVSGTCSFAVTDRVFSTTYVGRSNWEGDAYSEFSIVGLYVVDELRSETEISRIVSKMYQGEDTLQECNTCSSDATSFQGSVSKADCQCLAGAYKLVSEIDSRAISLVYGRARLSTLANRDLILYTSTAVFDNSAGPVGSKGAVTFDRSLSQYIDGGPQRFNIATNGGFTAVAVVKFTGVVGAAERVLDFGSGQNDNILLSRWGVSNSFVFDIRNGASSCQIYSASGVLVQDIWLTVVATYKSSDSSMGLRVGSNISTPIVCAAARLDRSVSTTNIGKSQWLVDAFSNVSIAGLYTVDELLSETEISKIITNLYTGDDSLGECQTCAGNTTSLQGSLSESDCTCSAATYKSGSRTDNRAISLLAGSAQLSTTANRYLSLYTSTAVFNSTAGPSASNGAVTFDRASSQYLDGGAHTFKIENNRGFTAVVVVKFPNTVGDRERIFDFFNVAGKDNLVLARSGSLSEIIWQMYNVDSVCQIDTSNMSNSSNLFNIYNTSNASNASIPSVIVQNTWLTIVARYRPISKTMELRVGSRIFSTICAVARESRIVSKTYVGRSSPPESVYSEMSIAGLYAVDALPSEAEISKITDRMYQGDTAVPVCQICPDNALSPQGSSSQINCAFTCPAGQFQSQIASNVARMCGVAQNLACPTMLSSTFGNLIASNGNDGNVRTKVHTISSNAPNAFRIDLEHVRNIHYVVVFNRFDCCQDRLVGAHIRIGSNDSWADNPVCPDADLNADSIQNRTCNMRGRYIFIVLLTGQVLHFEELQVFSACTNCPATAISLPNSTSPAACGCPAGSYEEIQVLNPQHAQRTYSSLWGAQDLYGSMLDDLSNGVSWCAATNVAGQWMEIDAGEPMHVVGIISQGRGAGIAQWITQFTVEYRLGDSLGANVALTGTFSMTDGSKKVHVFPVPIYARYVRIVVMKWNGHISMRGGLLVKSCASCPSKAVSMQKSTSNNDCECLAGAYKNTGSYHDRAVALVPDRAQLSSLANRNQSLYASTAVFDRTAGLLGSTTCRRTLELVAHYFSGTSNVLNDNSTRANHLGKWAPVAPDSTGPGWTGIARIAVQQSNPVWNLKDYGNDNPALMNALVLPGIMLVGISDAGFYRSNANSFDVVDFGRKCMSYNFWIRPAPLVASTWEQVIFASSDEKFTISFFVGRYDFYLVHRNLLLGDTHSLFMQDTWTHVAIQVGLNGMHYLHIDGVAIFSRSMFSVTQYASIDAFKTQTGYTNAIARGISLTYGQTAATHTPVPPMTQSTAPTGAINIGGFYAVAGDFYSRGRTTMYLKASISNFRVYLKSQLMTQSEIDCLYSVDAPRPVRGAVTFNRVTAQYIDGGLRSFNIATNGGFTAVAVVLFSGVPGNSERIFDFGKGENNDNILVCRDGTTSALTFSIRNGNSECSFKTATSVITKNTWLTIVATYASTSRIMQLRVGTSIFSATCSTPRTDRVVFTTYVARSNWASEGYFQGSVAGLYAVDALLSNVDISKITKTIYEGGDPLQTCQTCQDGTVLRPGSTSESGCECLVGTYKSALPADSDSRALVVVPGRAQVSTSTNRNVDMVRAKTGVDGWRLVRFLPPTSPEWYSGNDNLSGTATRGTAYNYSSEWSIAFGEFDEFCFSTRNFLYWLHCTKDAATGATYDSTEMNNIKQSSISNISYMALWKTQADVMPEDPWIGLRDHGVEPVNTDMGDRILYAENSISNNHWSLPIISSDGGMCVWVRSSANSPVASPVGGPRGMGAVIFDRGLAQYLDGGPYQFKVSTNGGFTAVAVVKFTGAVGSYERIFDFGNGPSGDNIILYRNATTSNLFFEIRNGNSSCVATMLSAIVQNSWLTIVAMYTSSSKILEFRVGGNIVFTTCAIARTDLIVSKTYVGGSSWTAGYSWQGSIAGLYTVDAILSEVEISDMTGKMIVGEDSLRVCQTCPINRVSMQGSTSAAACISNSYSQKNSSSAYAQDRAIALVPRRAQLATLANRNASVCTGTAAFNSTEGVPPNQKGALTFDRELSQYIDGGPHTFNLDSNGGFTAMAVVKFTGTVGSYERIFDFGNGERAQNIFVARSSTSTSLYVSIVDDGIADCNAELPNVITQNSWMTVTARYRSSTQTLDLRVGSATISTLCIIAPSDRVFSNTYIGRSNWPLDANFSGSMAGVYAVDALLNQTEISRITSRMYRGLDTLKDEPEKRRTQGSAMALVPGRAQLSSLEDRDNIPVFKITATMYGTAMSVQSGVTAWKLAGDVYVFFVNQAQVWKMTSVSASDAQMSSTPVSPDDRYILLGNPPAPLNIDTLQAMWDGTLSGFTTTRADNDTGYEVMDVTVSCSGQCGNIIFDSTNGPDGHGATIFNRSLSQFLDGGPHTFNLATNGGFTAVAVVKFTGNPGMSERIFDAAVGFQSDNIIISRDGIGQTVYFGIWNGGDTCSVSSDNVIVQDTWLTIVATYTSTTKTLGLQVGDNFFWRVCTTARQDRDTEFTYVGKNSNELGPNFQGSIAGLYVVDVLLNKKETLEITSRIYQGDDALMPRNITEAVKPSYTIKSNMLLTLVDTEDNTSETNASTLFDSVTRKQALVLNGLCEDALFQWVFSNARPCDLSGDWNPSVTTQPNYTQTIQKQLPCFLMQQFGSNGRQVTYFRGLDTADFYATYQNLSALSPGSSKNVVVNVSAVLYNIMQTGDRFTEILRPAAGKNVVRGSIQYDASVREDRLWRHVREASQERLCSDIFPLLMADTQNADQQYAELTKLLKQSGPCAPKFDGFSLWQNPSDLEAVSQSYSDVTASDCVLVVSTAEETGRDTLMALTRQYTSSITVGLESADNVPSHQYTYEAHFVTPELVLAAVASSILPPYADADYLRTPPKAAIIYDFGLSGGQTNTSWSSYALKTADKARNLTLVSTGGIGSADSRVQFQSYLQYIVPEGYNRIFVRFENRGTCGSVKLYLNSSIVASARAYKGVSTYNASYYGGKLEIMWPFPTLLGLELYIEFNYENPNTGAAGVKLADLTAGFCNSRNLLHVPKSYSTFTSRVALWTVPMDPVDSTLVAETSGSSLMIERGSDPISSPWIRFDLQHSTRIELIKIEFDQLDTWDAIKHYQIQIGLEDRIDANPVFARYAPGDNNTSVCQDCQPVLASIDPDLLVWLQFDDPMFIGRDSSIYMRHASIARYPQNGPEQTMFYEYKPVIESVAASWFATAAGDFETVKQACITGGGGLATINSLTENNIAASLCPDIRCYIGLVKNAAGFPWYWLSGDPALYYNWNGPGEGLLSGGETRVVMTKSGGLWDDWQQGAAVFAGVCRISATPAILALNSTRGPFWGSLLLANFNYLRIQSFLMQPTSDFTLSFWFVGLPPGTGKETMILHLSTADNQNSIQMLQSLAAPSQITTIIMMNMKPALWASSRQSNFKNVYSPSLPEVGAWNHYLLSLSSVDGTAHICINSQCLFIEHGEMSSDGENYSIAGFDKASKPLNLFTNFGTEFYCNVPTKNQLPCYNGQFDDLRFYQRSLTLEERQQIWTRQPDTTGSILPSGAAKVPARKVHILDMPAYIPWVPSTEQVVVQCVVPYVQGRYIFLKLPACNVSGQDCNTKHTIAITRVKVQRQRWYFNMSARFRQASAWSWSGDVLPNTALQQPWNSGQGLCFAAATPLFFHRQWMGLPNFQVTMDLGKNVPLTGLVFTYVSDSPKFLNVRVYYDIEQHFPSNRWEWVDLSLLGTSYTNSINKVVFIGNMNMTFTGEPRRARYIRIVVQKYPSNPPCIRVVPIVCPYFCVGLCQQVQVVDATTLPVFMQSITAGTVATVWHTGDKLCRCARHSYNDTVVALVFERVFATFESFDKPSRSIGMFECHVDDGVLSQPYDGRYSRNVLGQRVKYATGYKALLHDGIIDMDSPQPIIIQQGVATVIDWSLSRVPVVIAHQSAQLYNCDESGVGNESSLAYSNHCQFVRTDYGAGTTTILVPDTFATFADLKYFFRLQGTELGEPVSIVPVRATSPSFPSLFSRPAFSCTQYVQYTQVDTLCPCDIALNYTDGHGMGINISIEPMFRKNLFMRPGDAVLPPQYTHLIKGTKNERIRRNDHLFEKKPQPPVLRSPFFRNNTMQKTLNLDGDFVAIDTSRPMLRNQFVGLPSVGVLYKDVSYLEDPYRCDRVNGVDVCGSRFIANAGGNGQILPLINTVRPLERNRWRAIELQTEESYSGLGGSGFVQNIIPMQDWNSDISIHITPQVGINARYPSDSPRPFINEQRETMFHNYDDGTPVHMAVFVSSKKLNVSQGSTDWDWITCGALTQNPVPYPPLFLTSTLTLSAQFTKGPEDNPWYTAFGSTNVWVSQGGFLPDPPVCWDIAKDGFAWSAQSPKGAWPITTRLLVTMPQNTPCRLAQLEFPGPNNSAVRAGYSRCNITTSLRYQKMPCMYTLGDVLAKYQITDLNFKDRARQSPLYPNTRSDDPSTLKVVTSALNNTLDGYYVCHPQYSTLPQGNPLNLTNLTILRPDITCNVPKEMAETNVTMIQDCVCGIITKVFVLNEEQKHVETFIRVIPSTILYSEKSLTNALPTHGFITDLSADAVDNGNVFSIGIMTKNSTRSILPRRYFASDPGVAGMYATTPSMPAQYDICSAQVDPDNAASVNARNPYILDGIVVPLGKTMNIDQPPPDCCNFMRSHARVVLLKAPNAQGRARVGWIDGASATYMLNMMKSDLWEGAGAIVSNVARMCGVTKNLACPTSMTSTLGNDFTNYGPQFANDGVVTNAGQMAHSGTSGLNVFTIDFQEVRNIQYINFYNRIGCCQHRINGAEIRIGMSTNWLLNTKCANLDASAGIQSRRCSLAGRYIMIVLNGDWMNFDELQAFSTDTGVPVQARTFPYCSAWGDFVARSPKYYPTLDQNTYPCTGRQLGDDPFRPGSVPVPGTMLHVYDKVYVKTRGWIVVLFTQIDRNCGKISGGCQGENIFDWQVEHVRQPSRYTGLDFNYNIPNDAYMWKIGDLLFGGINGVGSCAARCPSSGEYDNIKGTIRWKPKIAPTAGGQEYWLYTMFSVGESKACKFFNCDEAAFAPHITKFSDVVPNPDGTHPLTFFEGTEMSAFVPYNPPFAIASGCILANSSAAAPGRITFRLKKTLFGGQRVTDFDFCVGCVNSVCQYDVMPCRWRSIIDTKWSYYMYVFHPSALVPFMLSFNIIDAGVIAVQYTNMTAFEGYTFAMVEVPKTNYETSAVTFDRNQSQFLDLGSRVLDISSNGGFTGVAVVKFTGAPGDGERIFDFGKGQDSDNILIARNGVSAALGFSIRNGNADCVVWTNNSVVPQNIWLTVVVTYTSATKALEIRVGDTIKSIVCSIARTNRVVTRTYVGRSNWASNSYLNGKIAGLYTIDALLNETQIAAINSSMYTSVTAARTNNINVVGYQINAASPMTYAPTPRQIPALAGNAVNIFTTPDMVCALPATTSNRRLLTTMQQDAKRDVRILAKSTRPVQRIYPLPQHGRKRHNVYSPRAVASPHIISADSTTRSPGPARVQNYSHDRRSGAKRMLFSTTASASSNLRADTAPAASEKFASLAREITSVNNNRQISDFFCGKIEQGVTCDMLSVKKEVSMVEFCLLEATFMQLAGTRIRAQLLQAASSSVMEIAITSISRPGAYYKCRSTAIRRLLQTETIHITYVTRANSTYSINLDILMDIGFSALQRLTALDGTKLAICTSISTSTQASVFVSVDVSDNDRVCHLSNAVAVDPALPQTTPTYFANTSLQHANTSSRDFPLQLAPISIYGLALIVFCALLVCVFAFCCVKHKYSRLSQTEIGHTRFNTRWSRPNGCLDSPVYFDKTHVHRMSLLPRETYRLEPSYSPTQPFTFVHHPFVPDTQHW